MNSVISYFEALGDLEDISSKFKIAGLLEKSIAIQSVFDRALEKALDKGLDLVLKRLPEVSSSIPKLMTTERGIQCWVTKAKINDKGKERIILKVVSKDPRIEPKQNNGEMK